MQPITDPAGDPRPLIARLAVAVALADGQISTQEARGPRLLPSAAALDAASQATGQATLPAALLRAFSVLGTRPTRDRSTVDAAYLALVDRFSPARVMPLGPEFEGVQPAAEKIRP